jgi:hypothetical protein
MYTEKAEKGKRIWANVNHEIHERHEKRTRGRGQGANLTPGRAELDIPLSRGDEEHRCGKGEESVEGCEWGLGEQGI